MSGVVRFVAICGILALSALAKDIERFEGCQRLGSLCCEGKNNTCLATGPRLNDVNSSNCFCDSACIELGDCCLDYAITCPVVDCELSEDWGEWSDCDARCGIGTKQRSRAEIKSALNGGKPCENSVQKAKCEGVKCKQARAGEGHHNEIKERGRIIPAIFGSWRSNKKYDRFQDIRKNLFEHYGDPNVVERPPYCAKFEIVDVHSACRLAKLSTWSKKLVKGSTVCVECQPFSMRKELGGRCRGHGVFNKMSEWKAVTVPGCHGKWVMTSRHEDGCQCDVNSDHSFVLV